MGKIDHAADQDDIHGEVGVMTLDEMAAALQTSGDYRVLRRLMGLPLNAMLSDPGTAEIRQGLVIDLETTGLDPAKDEIIELAMVPFSFSPADGSIVEVQQHYVSLRQPTSPIPPEITEITGIDDAMVAGCTIDLDEVARLVEPAALIIAHHAEFDRPFAEKLSEVFVRKCWACSMTQIGWRAEGSQSRGLASLITDFGYFYDGHRALNDAMATIELLAQPLPRSGRLALAELIEVARRPTWRVWALDSPFKANDALKARGYRWNTGEDGRPKSWHFEASTAEKRDDELAFLHAEIYRKIEELPVDVVTAFDRFAVRQLRGNAL